MLLLNIIHLFKFISSFKEVKISSDDSSQLKKLKLEFDNILNYKSTMASLQNKTFVIETEENPINTEPAIEESVIHQSILGDQTSTIFNKENLGSFYIRNDDNISQINLTKRKTDLTRDEGIVFKPRATNATNYMDTIYQFKEPSHYERSTTLVSRLENSKIELDLDYKPTIESQINNDKQISPELEDKREVKINSQDVEKLKGHKENHLDNVTETNQEK